nr:hypothetical protein [Tanacetum cinerariifolium]
MTTDPPDQTSEDYEQWEQEDLIVLSWLIQNIEPVAGNLTEYTTTKMLWDALVVTYSSGRDKLQTFNLHVKANYIKQNNSSLEDFWISLQGFLNALDRQYEPIKWEILRLDPLPSVEVAYATVRKEATHQNILGATINETQGTAGLIATKTEGLGLVSKVNRQSNRSQIGSSSQVDKSKLKCRPMATRRAPRTLDLEKAKPLLPGAPRRTSTPLTRKISPDLGGWQRWKQYATMMRQNKNLMDINIYALYNILKQNQGDVNDAIGSKKKTVVVTSNPLALIAEKINVCRSKEKVVVSSDSEGSEADDFSELKKITALLEKAFNQRKFYSKPTNNNLRTSSTSSRENKIKFAYDYENLNASYVNEKINFEDDYFQEIINPDFEKIDSPFQQTSSLKPYVPNVILENIIIDLKDEDVNLLEKEKANLETIESLKSKCFESSETVIFESANQSENECLVVEKCDKEENPKKKGSSNTSNVDLSVVSVSKLNKNVKRYSRKDLLARNNSHLRETSSAYVCNDTMNDSCNPRMCDLLDDKNFFIFDDESVKISPVSKMPFRKKPRDSMNVRSKSNMIKSLPRTIVQICLWITDSGCSKHMTGNRALLTNFVEKFLGTVRFGNNDFAVIAGYGDVVIRSMTIKKVYYVEGLGHNLFSVGQFCDKGLEVAFRKSTCFVRNEDGVDLLTGDRSSNLYTIDLNKVASNSLTCLLAKASSS